MRCAILIPTHKPIPNEDEIASLRNSLKVFAAYDVFILLPHDVSGDYYRCFQTVSASLKVINLEPGFLGSLHNYNAMGLSPSFYKKFEEFEYILICHLDAWVFRDALQYWMAKNYDYIGAPLFLPEPAHYTELMNLAAPSGGNGGLSLRRTEKMIRLTSGLNVRFNYFLFLRGVFFLIRNRRFDLLRIFIYICRGIRSDYVAFQLRHPVNEDVMISMLLALLDPSLRVAPPKISRMFCLEVNMAEIANSQLKLRLPFGVHGYDKYISAGDFKTLLRRQSSAYANTMNYEARPTKEPLVTIVTVIKNIVRNDRVETLKQCIESVRRQSYPKIEHLIVDGASDDGTLELLNNYAADPSYALKICSSADRGVWDAMAKGMALVSGELVNFLNSDDYFCDDNAIQLAVDLMRKEQTDWFFSDAVVLRADGSSFQFPTSIYGVFSCMGIVHQTVFVRKEILKAADPFTTPHRTKENYLFMLLIMNGFKYSYLRRNLICYREGGFSSGEYGGANIETTKIDFADYFYELAGRRWRMTHSDCQDMFSWQIFDNKSLRQGISLGLKLRLVGLKINYFKRLTKHAIKKYSGATWRPRLPWRRTL